MATAKTVTITVNGKQIQIEAGTASFQNIVAAAGQMGAATPKTAKLITVSSAAPSQGSTIGGNGSYNIIGGEVLTIA